MKQLMDEARKSSGHAKLRMTEAVRVMDLFHTVTKSPLIIQLVSRRGEGGGSEGDVRCRCVHPQ